MNKEEKAKAYDEVLNWMRAIYPSLSGADKEDAEHFFPDLRESEDERIRKAIIHYILYETKGNISEATEHVWVTYLEKQKVQKPAEWSEEDEDMLNSCISSIEEAKENRYAYKESDGDTSYDHEIAWLKSLRPKPHWKPNEEDLMMLEHIIEQYEIGNKNSKVMGYFPRVKELDFLKKVFAIWKS